ENDADRAAQRRHLRPRQGGHVLPQDLDLPLGGDLLAIEQTQQRGLAGAARAAERDELALAHPEGDIGQRWDLHRPDRIDLRNSVKLNHDGRFADYSRPGHIRESFSCTRRSTMAGLALPPLAFMTWPPTALDAAVLPLLKSATALALAAMAASTSASRAPASATWVSPSRFTMAAASSPEASMRAK